MFTKLTIINKIILADDDDDFISECDRFIIKKLILCFQSEIYYLNETLFLSFRSIQIFILQNLV